MKAIQYTAPRQFAVVDLPKPEPGPHQVVIRVKACGICKTDLPIHDGSFLAKFPLVNGHEFAGVIDSVGSAVTKWKLPCAAARRHCVRCCCPVSRQS